MPQKKNPDFAELIRGKSGRVVGDLMTLVTLMKGLPYSYDKDMQEDKEALFDALDTLQACLRLFRGMISTASWRRDRMLAACVGGFLEATDVAEYLVKKGLPFRTAHDVSAAIVRDCVAAGQKRIGERSLEELRAHSALFEGDIFAALEPAACVAARKLPGGPAPRGSRQVAELRRRLSVSTNCSAPNATARWSLSFFAVFAFSGSSPLSPGHSRMAYGRPHRPALGYLRGGRGLGPFASSRLVERLGEGPRLLSAGSLSRDIPHARLLSPLLAFDPGAHGPLLALLPPACQPNPLLDAAASLDEGARARYAFPHHRTLGFLAFALLLQFTPVFRRRGPRRLSPGNPLSGSLSPLDSVSRASYSCRGRERRGKRSRLIVFFRSKLFRGFSHWASCLSALVGLPWPP